MSVYAYLRDHSSVMSRPGTTHGAYARHIANAEYPYVAACDSRVALDLNSGESVGPGSILCQRKGCCAALRKARAA